MLVTNDVASGNRDVFCEPLSLMRLSRDFTGIVYATGNGDTFGTSFVERAVLLSANHD